MHQLLDKITTFFDNMIVVISVLFAAFVFIVYLIIIGIIDYIIL